MDNSSSLAVTRAPPERPSERPPTDDRAPVDAAEVAGGEDRERPFLVIDMSKMDPDIRASIVDDCTPPEETPQERAERLDRCKAATAEYDAEFGPLKPEEKAWADSVLDGSGDWMDEP